MNPKRVIEAAQTTMGGMFFVDVPPEVTPAVCNALAAELTREENLADFPLRLNVVFGGSEPYQKTYPLVAACSMNEMLKLGAQVAEDEPGTPGIITLIAPGEGDTGFVVSWAITGDIAGAQVVCDRPADHPEIIMVNDYSPMIASNLAEMPEGMGSENLPFFFWGWIAEERATMEVERVENGDIPWDDALHAIFMGMISTAAEFCGGGLTIKEVPWAEEAQDTFRNGAELDDATAQEIRDLTAGMGARQQNVIDTVVEARGRLSDLMDAAIGSLVKGFDPVVARWREMFPGETEWYDPN